MDCPSEENLIRMKLDGLSGIENLDFDIPNRKLTVYHSAAIEPIEQAILGLKLGGRRLSTETTSKLEFEENTHQNHNTYNKVGNSSNGLYRFVKLEKTDFVGKAALLERLGKKPIRKLVTLAVDTISAPAHGGAAVVVDVYQNMYCRI